jgi:DNA polymerase lambda
VKKCTYFMIFIDFNLRSIFPCSVSDLRDPEILKKYKITLTKPQEIGVQKAIFEDIQKRIPRSEVEDIHKRVVVALDKLAATDEYKKGLEFAKKENPDHTLTCQVCGSYRRGKDTCGDVDIIVVNPLKRKILPDLLKILMEAQGFITHSLGNLERFDRLSRKDRIDEKRESFMGICKLEENGLHRRLDIKVYPPEAYPYALLYFTGNDHFNRSMRHWAGRINLSLSDTGIEEAKHPVNDKKYKR